MTRIFDALKKAEAARETASPALSPASVAPLSPAPRPVLHARAADAARTALPLLGAVELDEGGLREMSALRVGLEAALRDRSPRIVAFHGAQGGEGTSTVALQFAQSLARDPQLRPLLVDGHARRPAFTPEPGHRCAVLERRLISRSVEQGAVVTPNLFVVPVADELRRAGLIPPAALRQLLDVNAPGFDWVILDGAPVLEAPDAAALGAVADGVVMVVQSGRTKRPVLTRAAELLSKAGARVTGSVLNRRVLEIPEFIYRRI
ncbi:MAG TPA: hypothetical protein VMH61_04940 [Candidatus Acidoferrales bacterium]|nr:hypothetical protein [Candidatus Acidoferrales bacterium]